MVDLAFVEFQENMFFDCYMCHHKVHPIMDFFMQSEELTAMESIEIHANNLVRGFYG